MDIPLLYSILRPRVRPNHCRHQRVTGALSTDLKLITHPFLIHKLRTSGAILPFSHVSIACRATTLPLPLPLPEHSVKYKMA